MKKINHNYKCWALLLCLLIWLPINSLAQTTKFDMVVEKTDGTELVFRITDDYPILQYQYGGEEGVNSLGIQTAEGWTSVPCPEIKRLFTREAKVIRGDVTASGVVDVQDATIVVNHILGNISSDYDYSVADMNNDNEIDVFDVTAIINIILNNGSASARRFTTRGGSLESINLKTDENRLLFGVDNTSRFTSFQFDVEVPQGVDLLGVKWNGDENQRVLQFAKNGDNHYTVVGLSMSSVPLAECAEGLLMLNFAGNANGEVNINNVLFVTPQGKAMRFSSSGVNIATGINGISFSQDEKIYDLSGRQLSVKREQLGKGVYIINNKKVVVQ